MVLRATLIVTTATALSCAFVEPLAGEPLEQCVDADSDPATSVSFHRDIRPIMNRPRFGDPAGPGCRECHYSTEPSHAGTDLSGLDLATLGALRRGGATSGAKIVVAGKPCSSVIVQKLLGTYNGFQMPKDSSRHWTAAEVQLVIDWIAEGAVGGDSE